MDWFDSGHYIGDLTGLVRIETESQNAVKRCELYLYLTEVIEPRLTAMGIDCTIHDNPNPSGGPILIGTRIEGSDLPTVLTYGHGDVTAGQAGAWQNDRDPYILSCEADHLYGRGTADNKAQHLINIAALEAVLKTRGMLGFNLKIIFEMSEEIDSLGLTQVIELNKDELRADVFIASDGPRLQPDTPTLFLGSRGGYEFELRVNLRDRAHHSGNWGGLLADPTTVLAHALANIVDQRGRILIAEWRPNSLSPEIRETLAGLPIKEESGPDIDPNWGEPGLTPAERVFGWNSFSVASIISGTPDTKQCAIPPYAVAQCELRYVVGTDVDGILPALRQHFDKNGLGVVDIIPSDHDGFRATRESLDNPWVQFAQSSLRKTTGKSPHVLPNFGGSLPNQVFAETLGLPTLWIPHSYRACSQHAPDEHVLISVSRDGLALMTGLFFDLGEQGLNIQA